MKLGIMQPYFFPYIGYFQLIKAVNKYVVYDNIEFTKKGWMNRNRILQNGKDAYITIPVKKDSDYLTVREREISADFNRQKMLNQIRGAYIKAPYFKTINPLIEDIINCDKENLFLFLYNSIVKICKHLNISTEIIISSDLNIDHSLKGEAKVIEICKNLNATEYYNAIGGQELYSAEHFQEEGITLKFLKTESILYKQFSHEFIPNLSIIDVMMFNSPEEINRMLDKYELV